MGLKNKFSNFFGLGDEDDAFYMEEAEYAASEKSPVKDSNMDSHSAANTRKNTKNLNNVVSMKQAPQQGKITIVEPRVYSEVKEITDLLLASQSVVLNFHRMEKEQAKKIVDFLMGAIYAIDGDMQRVGNEIFICTPKHVEIDGVVDQTNHFDDLDIF